jgi:ParB-like chromosome segregation protein Spo0J
MGVQTIMKLKASQIKNNPDNPRVIKDDKFKKLVQSIIDFPEMADVREVVVNKDHVILGGNMRFKAMVEAGWTEIPVRIVDWTPEQQREFIIKDNIAGGEWDWDVLANEWDADLLNEWGLEKVDAFTDYDDDDDTAEPTEKNEVIIKIPRDEYELIETEIRVVLQNIKHSILA